jgi:hypothetical protein
MRSQRDLLLRRYIQEIERKEAMAARMMSQGGAATGGDGGGEGDEGEESKAPRGSKRSKK